MINYHNHLKTKNNNNFFYDVYFLISWDEINILKNLCNELERIIFFSTYVVRY